jgi:hypothetical protein
VWMMMTCHTYSLDCRYDIMTCRRLFRGKIDDILGTPVDGAEHSENRNLRNHPPDDDDNETLEGPGSHKF